MIFVLVTREKRRVIDEYLGWDGREVAERVRVVEYEELAGMESVPRGVWVLADLDGAGAGGRALARALHETLTAAGQRVLNHPDRTLRRLELLRALHEAGINDFRAVPASELPSDLRYPVFVRGASDHFGPVSGLVNGPDEVAAAVERAVASGVPADDLIAVEYLETAVDGVYAKHGTYALGDRIIPQHVLSSREWMIKHKVSLFTRETCEEELRVVEENPYEERMRRVFRVAGVEYGRADYAVLPDGRVQVWEINLTPIIGRPTNITSTKGFFPEELRPLRDRRKELFNARFLEAWQALDTDEPTLPDIPFDVDGDVRREALEGLSYAAGEGLMSLLRAKAYFRNW